LFTLEGSRQPAQGTGGAGVRPVRCEDMLMGAIVAEAPPAKADVLRYFWCCRWYTECGEGGIDKVIVTACRTLKLR
jgi:hypothetical protein